MASKGVFVFVFVLSLLLAYSNARELSEQETQNVNGGGEMNLGDQYGPGPGGFWRPCYQVCPFRRCCRPFSPWYSYYYRRCCF